MRNRTMSPMRLAAALAAAALASACANQTTSYRTQRVGDNGPMVITQDAKTRNLTMVPETEPGRPNQWRVCAEAAPDVFSAMSASAAGELGLDTRGSGTQARTQMALAIAEAAGTIERTQTINMLRESMYRTCERYLSGAINQSALVVQAGRDWRAMIAILAIEQLTRTARPPSTIISGGATSAGLASNEEARRGLAAAQTRLEAARQGLVVANAMPCTPPVTPPVTPPANPPANPPVTPPVTAPVTPPPPSAECVAKTNAVTAANTAIDTAKGDVTTWSGLVNAGAADRVAAGTVAGPLNTGQGGGAPNETSLRYVATVVSDIVTQAFGTDETQLFCLQMLSDRSLGRVDNLRSQCIAYLLVRVENERERLLQDPGIQARANARRIEILATRLQVDSYLESITDEQFAADLPVIQARIAGFCRGLSRPQCLAYVRDQNLDTFRNQTLISEVVQARTDARTDARIDARSEQ